MTMLWSKLPPLSVVFGVAIMIAEVSAWAPSVGTRREVLDSLVATAVTIPQAAVAKVDASVILGNYTDPINHPGGTRKIELAGTSFGGFQLAKITGGGGEGEPSFYELPAMISPCPGRTVAGRELCITIDFSPKGGPRDFTGYWDAEAKGIRFPVDGNFWPQVPS